MDSLLQCKVIANEKKQLSLVISITIRKPIQGYSRGAVYAAKYVAIMDALRRRAKA